MQNQVHYCMQASALQPQHQAPRWHFSSRGDALQLRQQLPAAAALGAGGRTDTRGAEAVAHPANQVARVTAGIPSVESRDCNREALLH